jgi:hypothetical protein
MTRSPSGNPGGDSSKRPPLGISVASCCPIHLVQELEGGDPRKVTTSDVSLPRTQISLGLGLGCAFGHFAWDQSVLLFYLSRSSCLGLSLCGGPSTRLRGSDEGAQQRRSTPSTSALNQTSIESAIGFLFHQSEPNVWHQTPEIRCHVSYWRMHWYGHNEIY